MHQWDLSADGRSDVEAQREREYGSVVSVIRQLVLQKTQGDPGLVGAFCQRGPTHVGTDDHVAISCLVALIDEAADVLCQSGQVGLAEA